MMPTTEGMILETLKLMRELRKKLERLTKVEEALRDIAKTMQHISPHRQGKKGFRFDPMCPVCVAERALQRMSS